MWNLESGKCLQTLQHGSVVWVVRTDGARVVSGCERGLVRVWAADTGALIKVGFFLGESFCAKCLKICASLSQPFVLAKDFLKKKAPNQRQPKLVKETADLFVSK